MTSLKLKDVLRRGYGALKSASENELNGILGPADEAVVSQDFIGDARTSIVDAKGGIQLNSKFYKSFPGMTMKLVIQTN